MSENLNIIIKLIKFSNLNIIKTLDLFLPMWFKTLEIECDDWEETMGRLVHFEIHVDDMERAKQFYGEIFGWSFEDWSEYAACLILVLLLEM